MTEKLSSEKLTIEKWVYGGEGLARLDRRVFLTPLVMPGEVVLAQPVDKLHARLLSVEQAAPERVKPPCPYFGRCGGCHYQHAPYGFQLERKREILAEALRRIGKLEFPGEIELLSGPEWEYRNRIQLHFAEGKVGFRLMGSHKLCPIDQCPISSPKLNETIQTLAHMAAERRFPSFVQTVELFTNEQDVQVNITEASRPVASHFFAWCAERIPGFVPGPLQYGRFRVSGKSFFQVNRFLIDSLVAAAIGDAEGDTALELYAGVGLFTLALTQRFKKVIAVESSASASKDLKLNCGIADVEIQKAAVYEYLPSPDVKPSFVLADPPRAGLGKEVVEQLLRLGPPRLTIVACDPSTLARDLKDLVAGGYAVQRIILADLFPQTYHLETVVHLSR